MLMTTGLLQPSPPVYGQVATLGLLLHLLVSSLVLSRSLSCVRLLTCEIFADLSGEPEEEDDDVLLARAISLSAAAAAAPTPVSVPPPASVPVVADEPPIGTPGSATIKLRLPQGTASTGVHPWQCMCTCCCCFLLSISHVFTVPLVHRFNGEDSGSALFQWIDSVISPAPFPYDVCLPNGSAKLTRSDAATKSLLQLGFVPNVMLTVIRVASS